MAGFYAFYACRGNGLPRVIMVVLVFDIDIRSTISLFPRHSSLTKLPSLTLSLSSLHPRSYFFGTSVITTVPRESCLTTYFCMSVKDFPLDK